MQLRQSASFKRYLDLGPGAMVDLVAQAIDAHLQRIEGASNGRCDAEGLTKLIELIQELKKDQRAIAAIVDSSTTTLASILRGTRCEAERARV
jgi:hypothetical protein